MKDKNRFSNQLKHLMNVSKLKNYTLAKELQYDESYISKWVTGSLMPTEKTSEKVIRDISRCVVAASDADALQILFSQYQVDTVELLEDAIFDNLTAEFHYVMNLKDSTGSEVTQKTVYYPELTLAQFMQKLRHPVLRQVKSLNVIAAMDVLSLDRHYQLEITRLDSSSVQALQRSWPGVRFTMLMNPSAPNTQTYLNVQFLMSLLANFSNVDFQLYACPQAQGKLIFSVQDSYSISGMIMDKTHCLSVTTTEDQKNVNAIFDRLQSLRSPDKLMVLRTSMPAMLLNNEYIQYAFSRNQRWMLTHLTEHFLPDDLFEEFAEAYCKAHREISMDTLLRIHKLNHNIINNIPLRIVLSEKGLNSFAVTGRVDFFGDAMTLTPQQRLKCLTYCNAISEENHAITFGILRPGRSVEFQYIPAPTMFLSDNLCYLRLKQTGSSYGISKLATLQVCEQFQIFFENMWKDQNVVDTYMNSSIDLMRYTSQMLQVQIMLEK